MLLCRCLPHVAGEPCLHVQHCRLVTQKQKSTLMGCRSSADPASSSAAVAAGSVAKAT